MYRVGDKILYPMHGAGIIKEIEKREILGSVKDYYILHVPCGDMKVMIPVDNCDAIGVRAIVSEEEIYTAVDVLKQESTRMTGNWNKRYRENTERMQTGDILEVAAVVRNLVRTDRAKPLSTGEKKLLGTAKQILESELIYSGGYTMEEADELVESSI